MPSILAAIRSFLKFEAAGGVLLMIAAALALIAANTPAKPLYDALLSTTAAVRIGGFEIAKPLLLWINDGLMAVFFFLVGLEIKREVVAGEMSSLDRAMLPVFAAFGGMAAPALVYAAINWGDPAALRGWAIPSATDIAFALGVLMLLGGRVPASLKIFLLALAIIDDLGAIVIIAVFYASGLSPLALALAVLGFVVLIALNRFGVTRIAPYIIVGAFMWACVLKSGVHATLAGVAAALTIPIKGAAEGAPSPLERLESDLHPTVAFVVLPLFAFANAGLSFAGLSVKDVAAPIPLGVTLGLCLGKPFGILIATFAAVFLRLAKLPPGVGWRDMLGLGCIAGVGFTMSLFIGSLAFHEAPEINAVRLGVLAGSLASAAAGLAILNWTLPAKRRQAAPAGRAISLSPPPGSPQG